MDGSMSELEHRPEGGCDFSGSRGRLMWVVVVSKWNELTWDGKDVDSVVGPFAEESAADRYAADLWADDEFTYDVREMKPPPDWMSNKPRE